MENLYWILFGSLLVVCLIVEFGKGSKDKLQTSSNFVSFRNNYIFVYCLMMGECGICCITALAAAMTF